MLAQEKKTTDMSYVHNNCSESKALTMNRIPLYMNKEYKNLSWLNVIEKSVSRITNWYHKACRVMTNGHHEGRIFLFHPHTNNGFFFLLTAKYLIFYWKNMKKSSRKS